MAVSPLRIPVVSVRSLSATGRQEVLRRPQWLTLFKHPRHASTATQTSALDSQPDHHSNNRGPAIRRVYHGKPTTPSSTAVERPVSTADDSFYKYYLDFEIRAPTRELVSWPRLLESKAVDPRLQKSPLNALDRPHEDLDLVTRSLECFIAYAHRCHDSKSERRQLFKQQHPGELALRWFIESDLFNKKDLLHYPQFLRVLTYCLAAEDSIDNLWLWLSVTDVPKFAVDLDLSPFATTHWKGGALRTFTQAYVHWSEDRSHGLQMAINLLIRAQRLAKEPGCNATTYPIPPQPTGMWLLKELTYARASGVKIQVSTFEKFINLLNTWIRDLEKRELASARLHMTHPTTPNPSPGFEFLQKCNTTAEPSEFINDFMHPQGSASNASFFLFVVQVAQILHRRGDVDKARWTLDFGRIRNPKLFSKRAHPFKGIQEAKFQFRPSRGFRTQGTSKEHLEKMKEAMSKLETEDRKNVKSWKWTALHTKHCDVR